MKAIERQTRALELRRDGLTYREIAEKVGYKGPSSAYRGIMAALRRTQQPPADALRKLELERLDLAAAAIVEKVLAGDLQAIDRWVRLSESRRRLLGLDAPARTEITGAEGGPVLVATPEWQRLRALILSTLEAHPQAKAALVAVLLEAESGSGG